MAGRTIRTSHQIRQDFLDFFKSKGHTIVPSASLMPDSPNLLFTNAGMNQFVPIFLGQRECPYQPARAADTQKCIRAGGKHNDLEDVGLDTYHHTFFEMLGNWSFGDYFKREAIDWAWELITGVWEFPKNRLYATVYSPGPGDPSQFDEEAHDFWEEKFSASGLDPKEHIVYGNKKDNFWMMGETGPCGPCSELHVDLTPAGDTRGGLVNRGSPECIEIWNLVFIQFNANPDGTFSPLPARHVDTGMGFERVTSILQCTQHFSRFDATISNYETDIFRPLFERIEQLSGTRYQSTLPKAGATPATDQEKIDIAFRVVADHIRTLTFAIADGILPGNTDRRYVLRRILRRAVRYGRTLGFHEPFLHQLVGVLAETMGDVFPEVRDRMRAVAETIQSEEQAFNKTLDRGMELFREAVSAAASLRRIPAEFAFKLYDTYGFPLDLTELMAREAGFTVDTIGFDRLMEEQRDRGRAGQKKEVISASSLDASLVTRFVGYDQLEADARILDVVRVQGKTGVVLDASPFYAEMGGQVGDAGELLSGPNRWQVMTTQPAGKASLHILDGDDAPAAGLEVRVAVDRARRAAIQRHHTVTHLLHWALHEVVSAGASQKGSSVSPDKLTFDFNSAALTRTHLADIEQRVNERIIENAPVSWSQVPFASVKHRGDVMQFFGDKYGDQVRVVQVGGHAGLLDGYSMELCGGTHTRATGEIGYFRIVGEGAVAAGVRRIEAVAGWRAFERARRETETLASLADKINSPVADVEKKLELMLAQQKALERELRSLHQQQAAQTAERLLAMAKTLPAAGLRPQFSAILHNLGAADGEFLQSVADALKERFKGVVVLAGVAEGAVSMVASVSADLAKHVQAGKLIQLMAPIVGGRGGGKPEHARGGGKEVGKVDEALRAVSANLAG